MVHWLIGYVGKHSFKPFGWYRIVFGLIILGLFACGVVALLTRNSHGDLGARSVFYNGVDECLFY